MQVVDVIADAVARESVSVAFNVPDEVTVFMVQALRQRDVRIVRPRHEQNAVTMADGYARASGEIGVCSIGPGPAIAQTGTGLVTARRRRSPVLVLLGQPPHERGTIKSFDVRRFAEAMEVSYLEIRGPKTAAEDVHEAFRLVQRRSEPVILSFGDTHDLLTPCDEGVECRPTTQQAVYRLSGDPNSAEIEQAAKLLIAARRPVVVAGRGAVAAGARDAIVALGDRIGALLATSIQARELFRGHSRNIGVIGSLGSRGTAELVAAADCVMAIGIALNAYQAKALSEDATVIHVDDSAERIGEFASIELGLIGDARMTVLAIDQRVEQLGGAATATWTEPIAARRIESALTKPEPLPWPSPADGAAPDRIPLRLALAELDAALPGDRLLVVDAGLFLSFVIDHLSVPGPESWMWTTDFASIGLALGMGIGAALAQPERHIVVVAGDGGMMMNLQELETAVRERIPMTIAVLNNQSYGAEARFLEQSGRPIDVAVYDDVDFAGVARSLGASGLTLCDVDDIRGAAEHVLLRTGPLVLDLKVRENELSRMNESIARPPA